MVNRKKCLGTVGLFAAGVAFGTLGIKALSSKGAKKFYTGVTAAGLASKDCVMRTVTKVQENAGDVYEDAKELNEKWADERHAQEIEKAKAKLAEAQEALAEAQAAAEKEEKDEK
ncbi:DUF6110 family protein [Eubacterium oxidoreducens]|uniref:YtxH-like protein n=1 Tax=Eubacterium oxidoreducens TaxID=1732 RepID=A0A1G6CA47_EUBOX|nr:DUF6110 family protein [Eubacterium oxidoreducens]SDB29662.1 hypothetical protein SAMN02910417_02207 [Eubacterium oxidoreducens]